MTQEDNTLFFAGHFSILREKINHTSEWKILSCLVLFFAVWRLIALEFIEKSGDSVWKWSFLRYFHETGIWYPLFPDHHQGRWAQNLPVLGLMKIFGAHPWVYYILPLVTAFGVSLLCYWIARQLGDRFAGVLAFLLPMFFVHTVNESNQLLPLLPAAFWLLAAVALCFRYFSSGKHLWLFFVAGIFLGFSWGCKVTAAYWCVAIGLFLLFSNLPGKNLFRVWKIRVGWDVILLTLGFFSIFIPETVLLNHFFGVKAGRLSMLFTKHLGGPTSEEVLPSILEYLFSFQLPFKPQGKGISFLPKMIFLTTGIPILVLWLKKNNGLIFHRFFAFIFFVAYLLHSYVIVGIDPIRYPERPLGRYFIILILFCMIASAAGWQEFSGFLKSKIKNEKFYKVLVTMLVILSILFLAGHPLNETIFHNNNISRIIKAEKRMKLVRKENLPVLAVLKNPPEYFDQKDSDPKVSRLWVAFWGPIQLIPEFFDQTPLSLVHDKRGMAYNYLWGGRIPVAGEIRKCAIVSELDIRIGELQF
ncbi:MAG: glycosyltransferase family 39 protein [Deltaproteobacteria bacterium]|nr:glycosyltransferase family 39 protein [Deltaproteobacteria bacterium]